METDDAKPEIKTTIGGSFAVKTDTEINRGADSNQLR
jgi:hypothetical protein